MKRAIIKKELRTAFNRYNIGEKVMVMLNNNDQRKCTIEDKFGERCVVGVPLNYICLMHTKK